MIFVPSFYAFLTIAIFASLTYVIIFLVLKRFLGKNVFLAGLLSCIIVCSVTIFGLRGNSKTEEEFVILSHKDGHPVVLVMFRIESNKLHQKVNCQAELYTSHNKSIFTAAKESDVLKKYFYTGSYSIFGKIFWQDCQEVYVPVRSVSLYPDMNYWPFREGDIQPGDPDYKKIFELTKTQREFIKR